MVCEAVQATSIEVWVWKNVGVTILKSKTNISLFDLKII